ncbi:hypothetical protein RNB18_29890 [Streptomyces sp. DSM 41640]|uniref:Uncharacterized protein n=1 Tax=Streptomyces doebereineriae TaxID=3075528 RepID=A0ABU2VFN4_9ACTN|nr:hypothetical protein [Streptomyces sp. DSM 41640]
MTSGRSGHRDINADAAQATAKRIGDVGGSALAAEFDLADERSVRALFDTNAVDRPGRVDERYSVAANASADVLGRDGGLLDLDPAVWRRTLEVNLISFALTPARPFTCRSHRAAERSSIPPPRLHTWATTSAPRTSPARPGSTRSPATSPPTGASRASGATVCQPGG